MFSTWEGPSWSSDFPLLWVFPAHPMQLGWAGSAHQASRHSSSTAGLLPAAQPKDGGHWPCPCNTQEHWLLELLRWMLWISTAQQHEPFPAAPCSRCPRHAGCRCPRADTACFRATRSSAPEPWVWGERWLQKIHQDSAGVSSAQRAHGKQQRSPGASSHSKAAGAPPRSPVPGFPRVSKDLKKRVLPPFHNKLLLLLFYHSEAAPLTGWAVLYSSGTGLHVTNSQRSVFEGGTP